MAAAAAAYGGTTQKCMACEKTVYVVDRLTADNRVYHQSCFRCHHCNAILKLGNYNSFEGVLYCRPHFDQLFKTTGSLDKSFQGEGEREWIPCTGGASSSAAMGVSCVISPSNYIAHEGRLYCKHHHLQLIKLKGNYLTTQLEPTPPGDDDTNSS